MKWRCVCFKVKRYYQEAFLFCIHITNKRVFLRSLLHSCVFSECNKNYTMNAIFIIFWVALIISIHVAGE